MSNDCSCNEVWIESPVSKHEPDIRFTDDQGNYLPVTSINVTKNGNISSIVVESNDSDLEGSRILQREDISINQNFLHVPGVGYLPPGVVVRYNDRDWVLLFGWHTNISNQTIYSWFLSPTSSEEEVCCLKESRSPVNKTVYQEMVDQIDFIRFW